jgi:acyl-coenzyme A synthetase/AMP-(fatty) acid ligase
LKKTPQDLEALRDLKLGIIYLGVETGDPRLLEKIRKGSTYDELVAAGKRVKVGGGYLVLTRPWPGMLRGIWRNPERYKAGYWSRYPGIYFTGDGAKRDEDGYLWLLGRVDDVLNVAGHRIGTAEVESALVEHQHVAEAAVVGIPHELKASHRLRHTQRRCARLR